MIGFSPCDFARDASHENDVSEVGRDCYFYKDSTSDARTIPTEVGGVFSFAIKPIWKFGTLG